MLLLYSLLYIYSYIYTILYYIIGISLWPLFSQAIPTVLPPTLPPPLALLFTLIYIPLLLLATLNNEDTDSIMKNTPRKNKLIYRNNYINFIYYLFVRSIYIIISVFLIGWLMSASTEGKSGVYMTQSEWNKAMITYNNNLYNTSPTTTTTTNTTANNNNILRKFWLTQDMMSCMLLLSIISQFSTLQKRAQISVYDLPTPYTHPWLYIAILIIFIIHIIILIIRQILRANMYNNYSNTTNNTMYNNSYYYKDVDYRVWIALCLLPVCGVAIGLWTNYYDNIQYKRYMQYLRFDFETKLGQYSPR